MRFLEIFIFTSITLFLCTCGNDVATPDKRCQASINCTQQYCDQVYIPAGIYPRGSDEHAEGNTSFGGLEEFGDETPQHNVYQDEFCIDKYEVSLGRYWACIEAGVCDVVPPFVVRHFPPGYEDPDKRPSYPVIHTNWAHAKKYCEWIGRRLCTETEWERAANGPGPDKRTYPWGEAEPVPDVHGNFVNRKDYEEYVDFVDSCPEGASSEGVLNLSGNVYEWVSDWYAPYPEAPDGTIPENPTGPTTGEYKIGRGGCTFALSSYTTTERTTFDPIFDGG